MVRASAMNNSLFAGILVVRAEGVLVGLPRFELGTSCTPPGGERLSLMGSFVEKKGFAVGVASIGMR